jgi:hypothetical protein
MRPRRHLGYDAAKGPVLIQLRKHHIGTDVPGTVDHSGGGLIATRLDAEDDWFSRPVDHGCIRPFLAL